MSIQPIELIVRDKTVKFAEGSICGFCLVSHNDDYVMHFDLDEDRPAMFAKFVRQDNTSIVSPIDSEGYVLNKYDERKVPEWALHSPFMQVGVESDGYATEAITYFVQNSIKDIGDQEDVEPEDPMIDQLIALVNGVVAPEVAVAQDSEGIYQLSFTDKNGTIITPNLKGDPFTYDDFTPQQLENLKGDRGEKGEKGDAFAYSDFTPEQLAALKGAKGDAFTYEDFTPAQLASLKGDKGDAFTYADFTPAQLAALKGDKGDAFVYSDFTPEQLADLKGDKGDAFEYSDFTPQQLADLKGEPGSTGATGPEGKSAYQVAVDEGFVGTEQEWIASLKGEKGDTGLRGIQGVKGDPFTYADFTPEQLTALKVKGDKGDPFVYTDFTPAQLESLRGPQGIKGETGEGFEIQKTYASISAMNADFNNPNVPEGAFVMIASDVSDPDNAKLYIKGESAFVFISDLSGAQGIEGKRGPQGEQGVRGLPGVGVASATVNAQDHLVLTLTDGTPIDAGSVIGPQGATGAAGLDGSDGKSAYEIAVDNGFVGTEAQWLASLVGATGATGDTGDTGPQGVGVASATVNNQDHLIITLTDGTPIDAGYVKGSTGAKGDTGKGISSANMSNGSLTLVYTDGTSSDAFYIKGDTGSKGDKGDKGDTGATYTLTSADKNDIATLVKNLMVAAEGVSF